ncbi:MAG: hypothetical protein IKK03_05395 [Lachnospiraceae bacterium]|nr:hypothetical protein [Lachnospiraceae bacterium]
MRFIWEHNGDDTLLYSEECIGAFTRGANLDEAIEKIPDEISSYLNWRKEPALENITVEIIQEKNSNLEIKDADSDIIFDTETGPLTKEEYLQLKETVLQSALDFYNLYLSVPDKKESCLPKRNTFYGSVPRTAQEMYEHTKNVNSYYFGEIGIDADNEGTIYECRKRGFELLEKTEGFLDNPVFEGSYGEMWSLRKMMRRFLWHDRIHAKAMYRMAVETFGRDCVENVFGF